MHLRNQCALGAVVILTALAPAGHAQTTLRYQFKGGANLPYVMEQKTNLIISLMGMNFETKINMILDLSLNVVEVNKDGSVQMQYKGSGAKMTMEGPTGKVAIDSNDKNEPNEKVAKTFSQTIKAVGAMEMTAQMSSTGEMKNAKFSEITAKTLRTVSGEKKFGGAVGLESVKTMLSRIVFPAMAIDKGKSWSIKDELTGPFGKTITETTFTYEGTTKQNGVTLQKVSSKPITKFDANPNADVTLKIKSMIGNGQILFDNEIGHLVELTTTQISETQLFVDGIIATEERVEQTTTLRLKK